MRRRVVLYNPRSVFWTMPLALLAIGSALDASRYEVVIVDGRLEPDPIAAVLRQIDARTVCVGVTVLTGAPIRDAITVGHAVRAAHPALPIVWGGWHASLFPAECLEEESVSATVIGQGEDTFCELVDRFAAGQSTHGVAGSASRRGDPARVRLTGNVDIGPTRHLRDLNELPAHRYELIDVERYFAAKGRRQLDYISSQGCRFRCTFCADPQVFGRAWTGIDPKRMGEELDGLWRRYRFSDLNFQDETYFTHRARVTAVCDEILSRGLRFTWAATMRADQGVRLDANEWALCKRSGLRRAMVGVESGSQAMMDWLKKDIKLEEVFQTAEQLVRHDIAGIFPFIVGFPDETDESVEATLSVIQRLRRMSPDFEVSVYFYQPYPGSPIADMVWERGYHRPQTLSEWADFDYVGSRGPWVTHDKWERVQRFKFYQHHAFGRSRHLAALPLRWLSRARLRAGFLGAPMEKLVVEAVRP
ncbi:MAG: B12-binding domain-containing radical SAM protein, partial [Myxococcota bacterium]|nr:B12-binding domain-containing radical SAM protein [Myxococcota bacterium]